MGMMTNAGPGKTMSAMPMSVIVPPTTATMIRWAKRTLGAGPSSLDRRASPCDEFNAPVYFSPCTTAIRLRSRALSPVFPGLLRKRELHVEPCQQWTTPSCADAVSTASAIVVGFARPA